MSYQLLLKHWNGNIKKNVALYIKQWYNVNINTKKSKKETQVAKKSNEQLAKEALASLAPELVSEEEPKAKEKPVLDSFGFVMFKDKTNNTWYTAQVNFDSNLTTAEFSNKTVAGDEKSIAVERLKIVMGDKLFN